MEEIEEKGDEPLFLKVNFNEQPQHKNSKYAPLMNHVVNTSISGGFSNFKFDGQILFPSDIKYNAKSNRIRPFDRMHRCATIMIIVLPTAYTIAFLLVLNEVYQLYLKIGLGVLYTLSFYMSISMLFKASLSDPGILPSVNQIAMIPELSRKKPDEDRPYFVEYKTKS